MGITPIVTRGFGSFGSIGLVITAGYESSAVVNLPDSSNNSTRPYLNRKTTRPLGNRRTTEHA